jgi:anti-sigma regulatory factor (Ser/Thr protein kinase)
MILARLGFRAALERVRDVLALFFAAVTTTAVAATGGTASLRLGGVIPAERTAAAWTQWWLGDLIGDLVVAPAILAFAAVPLRRPTRRAALEAGAVALVLVAVGALAFQMVRPFGVQDYPPPFVVFSVLVLVAFRFGPRGLAAANVVVAGLCVWAVVKGLGLYARTTLDHSLLFSQTFMGVASVTSLVLAAAVGLVAGLLDEARARSGRLELELADLDAAALVRETAEEFATQFTDAGCELALEMERVDVHWDTLRMQQVVANLLTNAMKYGAGKPVIVRVSATERRARIEVVDHGRGVVEADRERIFARFERLAIARDVPGLGLGLHVARTIVEAHGGTVRVESEPGRGARFVVDMPKAADGRGSWAPMD